MRTGFAAFNERAATDGVLRAGEGLKGVETATPLRVRGGKVDTKDGPFAKTREHLGGFYLRELPGLDTALRYAALMPVAHIGTSKVRPVMGYDVPDSGDRTAPGPWALGCAIANGRDEGVP